MRRIIASFPLSYLPPGIETAEVGEKVTLFGKPHAATVVRVQINPDRTNLVVTLDVDPAAGISAALLDALEARHDPPAASLAADPEMLSPLNAGFFPEYVPEPDDSVIEWFDAHPPHRFRRAWRELWPERGVHP